MSDCYLSTLCFIMFIALSLTRPPPAEAVTQRERSPPLAESQQSKEVSSFSSSTSSPWDSPENPFQVLKPVPARAQSAPITLPTEPIDPIRSPSAASPPKSGDAFSSVSWSQSQWIAFSDNLAPARRQGFSVKELQRPHAGPPRSTRCLSDDSADAYCKTSGSREDPRFTDVFSGITERAMAAAQTGKILNGNIITDAKVVMCLKFGVLFLFLFRFFVFSCVLLWS